MKEIHKNQLIFLEIKDYRLSAITPEFAKLSPVHPVTNSWSSIWKAILSSPDFEVAWSGWCILISFSFHQKPKSNVFISNMSPNIWNNMLNVISLHYDPFGKDKPH